MCPQKQFQKGITGKKKWGMPIVGKHKSREVFSICSGGSIVINGPDTSMIIESGGGFLATLRQGGKVKFRGGE